MELKSHIFREYDVRGVAGTDLDEGVAETLGRAYATLFRRRGLQGKVVVGRDCRVSSPVLREGLVRGLVASGMEVLDVGMVATPVQYFALHHVDAAGGIQVTGSHNPPDHNGFKIALGKSTVHGEDIQELRRLAQAGPFVSGEGTVQHLEVTEAYLTAVLGRLRPVGRTLRVVVDAGNGMGGPYAVPLLERMGCTVITQFCDPDGTFPHHHADPTVVENMEPLARRVREEKADLGVAFDGDADRIGVVDETGTILWGDKLLVLYARDVLREVPGATIIGEVKCSQTLYDDIARHGGRPIMWKAGHSLIKSKMKEEGALLAGEMSGHMFFRHRYLGFDDAIYSAGRLVEILSRQDRTLSQLLSDVPVTHATPEIRMDCPEHLKFKLVAKAVEHFRRGHDVVDVDGARVKFPDGWGLVRASNTQPILVLRFEAQTAERLAEIRAYMEKEIQALRAGM
jgi:phosphomannomutase/phosphoglucomutase